MHQKEKSLSILREIDEALAKSYKPATPLFLEKSNRNSLTFAENKSKILNTFEGMKKQEPTIQDQINNSFKNLSIQTINTLISLKNQVEKNHSQNSNKKPEKKEQNAYNPVKKDEITQYNDLLRKDKTSSQKKRKVVNINDLTKEKKNKIEDQIKNLQSNRSLDSLFLKVKEKMQTFQDSYQNINEKIEGLLVGMRPEENNESGAKSGSPFKHTKNNVGKDELNYYTFQKTRKEGSGDRYTRHFEKFLNE